MGSQGRKKGDKGMSEKLSEQKHLESWYDSNNKKQKIEFLKTFMTGSQDFFNNLTNTDFADLEPSLKCDMYNAYFKGFWRSKNGAWEFIKPYFDQVTK